MDDKLKKAILKYKLKKAAESAKESEDSEENPLNFKKYTESAANE